MVFKILGYFPVLFVKCLLFSLIEFLGRLYSVDPLFVLSQSECYSLCQWDIKDIVMHSADSVVISVVIVCNCS